MSTVCSACGVAVTPGYVRCPKCKMALPTRAGHPSDAGGTALPDRGDYPMAALILGALAAVGVVVVIVLVSGRAKPVATRAAPTQVAVPVAGTDIPTAEAPATVATAQPTTTAAVRDPSAAIADLDQQLHRQKLWSTLERSGSRLDLRGTMCSDPAMGPALDAAAPALKAGGITKLRCLAQAGTVVLDRDL